MSASEDYPPPDRNDWPGAQETYRRMCHEIDLLRADVSSLLVRLDTAGGTWP